MAHGESNQQISFQNSAQSDAVRELRDLLAQLVATHWLRSHVQDFQQAEHEDKASDYRPEGPPGPLTNAE